jgi:hypothetical protein
MPDVTLTLSAQQASRVQAAFATQENPTPGVPEVKQWLVRQLRGKVIQYERGVAQAAIADEPFDPT